MTLLGYIELLIRDQREAVHEEQHDQYDGHSQRMLLELSFLRTLKALQTTEKVAIEEVGYRKRRHNLLVLVEPQRSDHDNFVQHEGEQ